MGKTEVIYCRHCGREMPVKKTVRGYDQDNGKPKYKWRATCPKRAPWQLGLTHDDLEKDREGGYWSGPGDYGCDAC